MRSNGSGMFFLTSSRTKQKRTSMCANYRSHHPGFPKIQGEEYPDISIRQYDGQGGF